MIIVVLVLVGLCFGSFVNALVWRLHEQEKSKEEIRDQSLEARKSKAKTPKNLRVPLEDLSILKGRSMCPNCKHTLAWYDLLPVVSWLSLRGKCRYCHKPISWQYPLVELATACLFIFSYVFWPTLLLTPYSLFLFGMWLVFLTGFMALTVYDLRWMILPDRVVRPLQVLAAVYVLTQAVVLDGGSQVIIGALWGVVFGAGIFYLLYQISKGKWIGGGDVKLAVVLGLILGGPANVLLMIFLASTIGSIVSIPLLMLGKAKQSTRISFGPLLIIATIVVYLFGASLLTWYERQLLLV